MSVGRDVLRLTTAGSVDDGKSTLIGRLLLETGSLHQDHVDAVTAHSRRRRDPHLDLALFTDGLKAEREQRITIDVAYRYFSTARRKFIIADCPGHIQYTRNMVTGASTAELAVVLIDARKGLTTQSKRHAFIATLLGTPHLVVAINKMDLVDFTEEAFHSIRQDFCDFASRLETKSLHFIPLSALHGDNVVEPSANMPWYRGSTLLHHLENVNIGAAINRVDFRLPIQCVIRPHQDFRGVAGRIASGRIQVGDEVACLPSGAISRVKKLFLGETTFQEGLAGQSVVLQLEDDIDAGRGDLLVRRKNLPHKGAQIDATLCWLSESPARSFQTYILNLAGRETRCHISRIDYRINVDTMHREESESFQVNDIGRAQIQLNEPLFFDSYKRNRETGSFILIDPVSLDTIAAGMIRGTTPDLSSLRRETQAKRNLMESERLVSLEEREHRRGHSGCVVWLTGLSGSGKSTLAKKLERRLFDEGREVFLLDGDSVRMGLCSDLGFTDQDRRENIRRITELAALLAAQSVVVICSFISPFRADRENARRRLQEKFLEVHVDCSLQTCEERDPKGLYARARRKEIENFTGIDSPYEKPLEPDLYLNTEERTSDECVEVLRAELQQRFTGL